MIKALLLAGGFGTRLRPITDKIPKCLVLVNGQPLLKTWTDLLQTSPGIQILINTHYLADQVNQFVSTLSYRNQITLSHEVDILGTAGTLMKHREFFDDVEDFLVIHADNYTHFSLENFYNAHKLRPPGTLMSMMTFTCDNPEKYGVVECDAANVVVNFYEKIKNAPSKLANGAIYFMNRKIFTWIDSECLKPRDISLEILPRLMGKIYAIHNPNGIIDIGSPEALSLANSKSLK